ncbi:KH domain-containing protein [Patescibacteria group bacterium]|nr:KH domain-containing protein [Patescibacteria group bacterium]
METRIKKIVSEFLVYLGLDFADVEVEKAGDKTFRVNITSDDPSLLIGYHGENLQAMQKILKVVIFKQVGEEFEIKLDIDDYRKRQEENVLTIATQKAEEVRKTKVKIALPPMSPYFRRLVHLHLMSDEWTDIETESMGEGDYRQVVIKPVL